MKKRIIFLAALLALAITLMGCQIEFILGDQYELPEGELRVHFIDVGQGDAILVQSAQHIMLIDGGDRGTANDLVAYLQGERIEHIDIVVSTHPHADHIAGLLSVLENFTIGEVIDPGVIHTSKTFEDYLTLIDQKDIKFTEGRAGMKRDISQGYHFEILHPHNPSSRHLNDASIVIKLTFGEISFMFTGDVEAPGEREILERGKNLKSQILKVSHHGSSTSSTEEFLKKVAPEVGIIMVGANNRYGHPHRETMEILQTNGIEVYRTDLNGTIIISTDGEEYSIDTKK